MLRLMNERDEIKVVADQIGAPTWASTLAVAIWAAVGKSQLQGIYHWSDAGVASWYDFAVAIQEEALSQGKLTNAIPNPSHSNRPVPHPGCTARIQRA
jgi:dTDP-4-dehydrorhamnose reductase